MGEIESDVGNLDMPSRLRIASVAQETPSLPDAAIDFVLGGDAVVAGVIKAEAEAMDREDYEAVAELHHRLEELNGYDATARAGRLLHGLGFPAETHQRAVSSFSGGWRVRLNLARALMCPSDLLLLDEPTNHLDLDMREALAEALSDFDGAIVLVSHDRHLIGLVCDTFWRVANGHVEAFDGDLDAYAAWLRSRGPDGAQRQIEKPALAPAVAQPTPVPARDSAALRPLRQRLQKLETQLDAVREQRGACERQLADPALYAAGGDAARIGQRQRELQDEEDALEAEWLALYAQLESAAV
jgi:ATPase subunit of ABC transporter with duplicated ATPase domains